MSSYVIGLTTIFAVLFSSLVIGDVYQWTDDDGSVHATDDPGQVPNGVTTTVLPKQERVIQKIDAKSTPAAARKSEDTGPLLERWRRRYAEIVNAEAELTECRTRLSQYCEDEYYETRDPNIAQNLRTYLNQKNSGETPDSALLPELFFPSPCGDVIAKAKIEHPADRHASTCLWRVGTVTAAIDGAAAYWQTARTRLEEEVRQAKVPMDLIFGTDSEN